MAERGVGCHAEFADLVVAVVDSSGNVLVKRRSLLYHPKYASLVLREFLGRGIGGKFIYGDEAGGEFVTAGRNS